MEMRLQKVLAQAGLASRRKAEALIAEGRVEVNGAIVRTLGTKVDPDKDLIRVDGALLKEKERKVYYALYKPPEMVTTLSDPEGRATVADCLQGIEERVFVVGRLDWDAEGALIVTNDGELAHRLMHPRFGAPRTYLAKVKGEPDEATLAKLREGVLLEDGIARPESVEVQSPTPKNTWLRMVVTEGRPHLIKRLCAAIGHPVVRLFRPQYAGVSVEGMAPGTYRPLTAEEIAALRRAAEGGGEKAPPAGLAGLKLPARRHRAFPKAAAKAGALTGEGEGRFRPREDRRAGGRGAEREGRFGSARREERPPRFRPEGEGRFGPRGDRRARGQGGEGEGRFGSARGEERPPRFRPEGEGRFGPRGDRRARGQGAEGEGRFGSARREERPPRIRPEGEGRFGPRGDRRARGQGGEGEGRFGSARGEERPPRFRPEGEGRFGSRGDRRARGQGAEGEGRFGSARGGGRPPRPRPEAESRFGSPRGRSAPSDRFGGARPGAGDRRGKPGREPAGPRKGGPRPFQRSGGRPRPGTPRSGPGGRRPRR